MKYNVQHGNGIEGIEHFMPEDIWSEGRDMRKKRKMMEYGNPENMDTGIDLSAIDAGQRDLQRLHGILTAHTTQARELVQKVFEPSLASGFEIGEAESQLLNQNVQNEAA